MKLILPFPPYVNQLYGTKRNGQKFKKKAHRAFFTEVHRIIQDKKLKPLEGELEVSITLFRPRDTGDIDGPLKTLFDAMEQPSDLIPHGDKKKRVKTSDYGVYVDDKQIIDLHVYKRIDKNNPRVEVLIG